MARKKPDIEVVTTKRLKSELGPDERVISKAAFFSVLDSAWDAWGDVAMVGDICIPFASAGGDFADWLDEWLAGRVK